MAIQEMRLDQGQKWSLLACCVLGFWANLFAGSTVTATNGTYLDYLKCGPNSLFLFLLLIGRSEVRYEQMNAIPLSAEGTSLLLLRDAARRLGVDTEVRYYSVADIDRLPLPTIAQLNSPHKSKHFVVVYRTGANGIYAIDGTTGEAIAISRTKLSYWTGFALVEKRGILDRYWIRGLLLCLIVVNCATIWICSQSRQTRFEGVRRRLIRRVTV